jgi:hypothetical protein
MIFPDDEMTEGLKRLGLHPEAQYLSQWCIKALQYVVPDGASDGALLRNEGRRSFAADILNLMELREASHDRKPDAAELARHRAGVVATGQRGIGRRLPDDK